MNGHQHGAFGAICAGSRDLTHHTSAQGFTPAQDIVDETTFMPRGGKKSYLYGLNGAAASRVGYFVNNPDFLLLDMAQVRGVQREAEPLAQAWFGWDLGNLVTMSRVKSTAHNVPTSTSSIVGTSVNWTLDSSYWHGHALWNPFGTSAFLGTNEVQTLTFTALPTSTRIGVRAATGTTIADVAAPANSASWRSAIESLPEYTSCTVAGTVSSGGGNYSGTKTVSFDGGDAATNVPALVVVYGEVRTIAGSDTVVYNGVTLTPGDLVADIQAALRTAGETGVVVSGTSTAASGGGNYAAGLLPTAIDYDSWPITDLHELTNGTTTWPGGGFGIGPNGANAQFSIDLGANSAVTSIRFNCIASVPVSGSYTVSVLLSTTGAFAGEEVTKNITLNGSFSDTARTWQTSGTFSTVNARYVRVPLIGNVYISEIEINGTPSAGALSLTLRYPASAGNLSNPTTTGGAVATTVQGGTNCAEVVDTTAISGRPASGEARWHLTTDAEAGEWHDAAVFLPTNGDSTATGFYSRFHALLAEGDSLTLVIEHNDAPEDEGAETLHSFEITDPTIEAQLAQEYTAATGTVVKRYVRARVTECAGAWALAIGYARRSD